MVTLAGTIYVLWLLPDALLRFGLWLLTRTLYRVRVLGRENIPEQRRRAVRLQSRFLRGRAVAHRLHGPARAVYHVRRAFTSCPG